MKRSLFSLLALTCCISNVNAARSGQWWNQFWSDFREYQAPKKVFIIPPLPPPAPPSVDISTVDACLENIAPKSSDETSSSFMAREWLLNEDILLHDVVELGCPRLQQRYAMVDFYYSLNGTRWYQGARRNFLDVSTSECEWKGVSCEESVITSLDFVQVNAIGPLQPSLSALTSLTSLNLQTNIITGVLPFGLFEAATNLTEIVLEGNYLTAVPATVSNLVNLQTLQLGENLLETFPIEVTGLSNLEVLDLHENRLAENIPTQIGSMVGLKELSLASNEFEGPVPASLGNLVDLQILDLSDNELSGTFPTQLGNLVNLQELYLNKNNFSGSIPQEFAAMAAITTIRLDNNDLTGFVPSILCELYDFKKTVSSYIDCENDVGTSCFTFCCSDEGSCVCQFESTDPLRCII